ncbi:MAG TPA: hypothetical protein VMT37_10385 [Solirubrobacterales bacterium]|nr:hypothetical protein [Solirubrobacterales bacterium]
MATCATALALAGSASAATYPVSGKQIVVDEAAGTYKMNGGLVGKWEVTSFKELGSGSIFRAKGTERFKGCLDLRRDRSCAGDPSGTLSFTYLYWGEFEADDTLVWGSCWHPVVGGTGDFKHARGVLTMVDTPTAKGVSTSYTGNITLGSPSAARAAASASATAHCG